MTKQQCSRASVNKQETQGWGIFLKNVESQEPQGLDMNEKIGKQRTDSWSRIENWADGLKNRKKILLTLLGDCNEMED